MDTYIPEMDLKDGKVQHPLILVVQLEVVEKSWF